MKSLREAWSGLARRERRTVVAALVLLAVAWLALRVVPYTVREVQVQRDRSAASAASLARARATLAAEPVVRESLGVRLARLVAWAPRLFGGATGAESAAELASYAAGAAELRRVRIVRQDARADTTVSVFDRLTLRLEAEGDIAGLTGWIADLEEGQKLVIVRTLTLSAPEPAAPAGQAERLRVELVIEAWAAPRTAEGS